METIIKVIGDRRKVIGGFGLEQGNNLAQPPDCKTYGLEAAPEGDAEKLQGWIAFKPCNDPD